MIFQNEKGTIELIMSDNILLDFYDLIIQYLDLKKYELTEIPEDTLIKEHWYVSGDIISEVCSTNIYTILNYLFNYDELHHKVRKLKIASVLSNP